MFTLTHFKNDIKYKRQYTIPLTDKDDFLLNALS